MRQSCNLLFEKFLLVNLTRSIQKTYELRVMNSVNDLDHATVFIFRRIRVKKDSSTCGERRELVPIQTNRPVHLRRIKHYVQLNALVGFYANMKLFCLEQCNNNYFMFEAEKNAIYHGLGLTVIFFPCGRGLKWHKTYFS